MNKCLLTILGLVSFFSHEIICGSVAGADRLPLVLSASSEGIKALDGVVVAIQNQETANATQRLQQFYQRFQSELIPLSADHYLRGDFATVQLLQDTEEQSRNDLVRSIGSLSLDCSVFEGLDVTTAWREEGWILHADQLWRGGEVEHALRLWTFVESQASAEIRKRLILNHIIQQNRHSAKRMIARYAREFPSLQGTMLGHSGLLHEVLDNLLWETLQATPKAAGRLNQRRIRWQVPVAGDGRSEPTAVIIGDTVMLSDTSGTRALDVVTGQSRWPVAGEDSGHLLPAEVENDAPVAGMVTGIIHENLWIAMHDDRRLYAFDLTAEGRLAWTFPPRTDAKDEAWLVSGPPLSDGTNLVVPLRSTASAQQVRVVQLNGRSGQLLWTQPIGAPIDPLPALQWKDQTSQGVGEVFLNLSGTCLVCLEQASGRIRWVRSLPGSRVKNDLTVAGLTYTRGTLLALSPSTVTAVNPNTGTFRWTSYLPPAVEQLVGIIDATIVLRGHSLWGLDLESGTIRWQSPCEDESIAETGHSFILGDNVLWVTHSELLTITAHTGRVVQRDLPSALFQHAQIQQVTDAHLLLASPTHLSVIDIVR